MKKLFTLFGIAMLILFFGNSNLFGQVTISGSVGVDGVYTSLTNAAGAFLALNGTAQTGATITITITGDVTTEAGTNGLNAGAWTSINIVPSGARTISGASTAGCCKSSSCGLINFIIRYIPICISGQRIYSGTTTC